MRLSKILLIAVTTLCSMLLIPIASEIPGYVHATCKPANASLMLSSLRGSPPVEALLIRV